MDDVARSRRLLLTLIGALSVSAAGGACARPPESPAGVSSVAQTAMSPARDGGAAPKSAAPLTILPADFRARYAKLSATRFLSQGHAAGRFEVEVYANEVAKAAVDRHAGTFAVGAVLVKEHWERSAERAPRPGPVMAMEKMAPGFDPEHGDWRYVVVAAESGEVLQDGKPDGCVLCHDDAPHDHVFKF